MNLRRERNAHNHHTQRNGRLYKVHKSQFRNRRSQQLCSVGHLDNILHSRRNENSGLRDSFDKQLYNRQLLLRYLHGDTHHSHHKGDTIR